MSTASLPSWLRAALDHYAALLRATLGERLREVRLYGSWSRGEARPDSDVDVWVLVDRREGAAAEAPFALATDVLLAHEVELTPTVMDEAEWSALRAGGRRFARDIDAQGIAL